MDKAGEQLREAISRYEAIEKREKDLPGEVIKIEKRIMEEERGLERKLWDIEELRKQRQAVLVTGGKIDHLTLKIKESWEGIDIGEDTTIGFKKRAKDLREEQIKIVEDKNMARDEIIKLRLVPIKESYNTTGKAHAESMKDLYSLMEEWGINFGEAGWGRYILPSSWPGFKFIPCLYSPGEPIPDDFFNLVKLSEQQNEKSRKRAFEQAGLLKKAE